MTAQTPQLQCLVVSLALGLLWCASAPAAQSADGLWQDVASSAVAKTQDRVIQPERYRLLRLDVDALRQHLEPVAKGGGDIPLELPLPEGGFLAVMVTPVQVMAPALAARYPEIRTYQVTAANDPTVQGRLSLTPAGFQGMVMGLVSTLYIDPYQRHDDRHYQAYYRKNRGQADEPMACGVDHGAAAKGVSTTAISHGTERRTYRLAVATTGEYTQYHGGSVAQGLAAVVTMVNRVNLIYERDVAVRLELIANNDLLIYTNALDDPYSGTANANLTENRQTLNEVIGSANYDVGHLLSTIGGGLASVRATCGFSKAEGTSGSSQPSGDSFYVDLVAHELGHQFGGLHPHSQCSLNDGQGSARYEPFSGSTIMAYAGVCGPADNLQNDSDDYFHAVNLQQIVSHISSPFSQCPQQTPTGNQPPTVDAGSNSSPAYTIPANTPFELRGTASDNAGTLTYTWEQFDNGSAEIRSYPPSLNPVRTIPRLTNLLANDVAQADAPPTASRDISFMLTVRDNVANGGAFNQDQLQLRVEGGAGPFRVTEPNSGVLWSANQQHPVTWDTANTDQAPVNCTAVDIRLSQDSGLTYPLLLVGATPNDGQQTVTVPDVTIASARLKISCSNNLFFDISDVGFAVQGGSGGEPGILRRDGFESAL